MKKALYLLIVLFFSTNCILTSLLDQKPKTGNSGISSIMLLALGGVSTSTTGNVSTATVTTSGGTVMATDGSFSLDIPTGALSETRQITVTRNASAIGSIPEEMEPVTTILKFEPEGLVFAKPATLTINYEQGETEEAGLEERMVSFNYVKDDSTLEEMNIIQVDYALNHIVVEVNHFSFAAGLKSLISSVNSGKLTNPTTVNNLAKSVIIELAKFSKSGFSSAGLYFQSQSGMLGPFHQHH